MNNPALTHRLAASEWEPKYPFDLVVAYEDSVTRDRALHLYDHLAQELLDDYDFQCSWWKFDHLANSTLRQQSADSAAEANMIILSLHAHREMPASHKAWIESWLPRRDGRKSALVTLITGQAPEKDSTPMLTYLHRVARAGKMDFFPHGFDLPRAQRERSAQQITDQARAATHLVPEILQQRMPVPRWGINE
jgi:hypothetical protein